MNKLIITSYSKHYAVELGDNKLHILNQRSLYYFLKNSTKYDSSAISSVIKIVQDEGKIVIDLTTHKMVA